MRRTKRASKTRRGNETSYETPHEMKDETNKNDKSKQRDDRIERTRRPHGTHRRDERRDDIGGTSTSAADKRNQAHGEKKTSNQHIHRPPPHRLLPIARRPQIIPRPQAEGRAGGEMDSKQGFPHPMSDCRHIATCPTPSSNSVNEIRTMRKDGEGEHRPTSAVLTSSLIA